MRGSPPDSVFLYQSRKLQASGIIYLQHAHAPVSRISNARAQPAILKSLFHRLSGTGAESACFVIV